MVTALSAEFQNRALAIRAAALRRLEERKTVAILFSGGVAPAANSTIHAAVVGLHRAGFNVVGFLNGYEHLVGVRKAPGTFDPRKEEEYIPFGQPGAPDPAAYLKEGVHYVSLSPGSPALRQLMQVADKGGVFLGSSRVSPGKKVKAGLADMERPEKVDRILGVTEALAALGIGALTTLGGDDTLTSCGKMDLIGQPADHGPKTIDNDVPGMVRSDFSATIDLPVFDDFQWGLHFPGEMAVRLNRMPTFGWLTVMRNIAKINRNLMRDAVYSKDGAFAGGTTFLVETMGRNAGWIALASALLGCTPRVIMRETLAIEGLMLSDQPDKVDLPALVGKLARMVQTPGYKGGVVVLAENIVEAFPAELQPEFQDSFGNVALRDAKLAATVRLALKKMTGRKVEIVEEGYAHRCADPIPQDRELGARYGEEVASLVAKGKFGYMADGSGTGVPIADLIDPDTLKAKLHLVDKTEPMVQEAIRKGLIEVAA